MPGDVNLVVLVGCGSMAIAYAKVLQALGVPFAAVGRGTASAAAFASETGVTPAVGGLAEYLAAHPAPARAIVAIDVPGLQPAAALLLDRGVRDILLEKPAGLDPAAVADLTRKARQAQARIAVAYNRRYYASVRKAREIIEADGGATSCRFEFTELAHQIAGRDIDVRTKRNWFYANSTHVLDLAFFLAGSPKTLTAYSSGGLDWHPAGAVFVGAGETRTGAAFSYHADWTGPGRWGVEVVTRRHRLFLQPLEELRVQTLGSFAVETAAPGDDLDRRFKPGVYRQVRAFLSGEDDGHLLALAEHSERMDFYAHIVNGTAVSAEPGRLAAAP